MVKIEKLYGLRRLINSAIFCFLTAGSLYAATGGKDSITEWREWISPQQDYLDKVESLMQRGNEIEMQQTADLQDAINKKDQYLGDNIIIQNTGKLSAIVDALKALTPPKEFNEYHEKIIVAFQFTQMANEATSKKDAVTIKDCGNKAMASEIEALESIKKLYSSHGAPLQIIDSIDRGIASYKQKLAL